MSYCNFTAERWIYNGQIELTPLDEVRNCWPWEHLTLEEWVIINKQLKTIMDTFGSFKSHGKTIVALFISSIGILGSFLSGVAVWRKAIVKKERFYQWMFAIAVLDFFFNLFQNSYYLAKGELFPNLRSYQYLNTHITIRLYDISKECSFSSDLCTFCLTFERLWVLRKNLEKEQRGLLFTIIEVCLIIALVGLRCFMLEVEKSVVVIRIDNSTSDFIEYSWDWVYNSDVIRSIWWTSLAFVIFTIAPCVLLFLMILLSVGIGVIAFKRRKSAVFDQASAQQQQEVRKQSRAIIRLCFVLSFLFVLCQVGYCLNAISILINNQIEYTFTRTYAELVNNVPALAFTYMSSILLVLFECLSKSLNFFAYFLCSLSFREEFRDCLRRIFCRAG